MERAKHYDTEIVSNRKKDLEEAILRDLKQLFTLQVDLIRANSLKSFQKLMRETFSEEKIFTNFGTVVAELKEKTLEQYFDLLVRDSLIEGADWSCEKQKSELLEAMEKDIETEKAKQAERNMKELTVCI